MLTKLEALAKYLETVVDELTPSRHTDDGSVVDYGDQSWLVFTDDEADKWARCQILDSLWAFKSSFLSAHIEDLGREAIELIQNKPHEDANPVFRKLIRDLDHFVDDAISCDGRGHFLSGYNGEEIELDGGFFAYRQN